MDGAAPGTDVVAVVVTHRRPRSLASALDALLHQATPPSRVVVVDNADDPDAAAVVAAAGERVDYVPSRRNLGGAGGFALGALHALACGADWVWFADDDGRPADEQVLSRLLRCAGDLGWDVVSPLVVDASDPQRLAFPLRSGLRWRRTVGDVEADVVPGTANLFNGTLMSAEALMAVGLPDLRLFLRGDEVDVHRRVQRAGVGFGTCATARYLHPQGQAEWRPVLGGRARVLVPDSPEKQARTYRNLGYLTSLPGLRWRMPFDVARYGWYFLLGHRDPEGFRTWWALWRAGRAERFGDPAPSARPRAVRRSSRPRTPRR